MATLNGVDPGLADEYNSAVNSGNTSYANYLAQMIASEAGININSNQVEAVSSPGYTDSSQPASSSSLSTFFSGLANYPLLGSSSSTSPASIASGVGSVGSGLSGIASSIGSVGTALSSISSGATSFLSLITNIPRMLTILIGVIMVIIGLYMLGNKTIIAAVEAAKVVPPP